MLILLTLGLSFVAAILCAALGQRAARLVRWVALGAASVGFVSSLIAYIMYRAGVPEGQWMTLVSQPWVPMLGIRFQMGVDAISLLMMTLNGLIAVTGVLISWDNQKRVNEFFAHFLALVGGVYGVFMSMDLFLLFVCYEIAIVPKYFLIAIWGGERREYAAMKLVLYSFGGSALVLFGIIGIHLTSPGASLNLAQLMRQAPPSPEVQNILFPVLFVGFGILAGMWPFHTWAPTGHVAAPTAASMLLAGVVMKLGAYGCLRVAIGLLPTGAKTWAPVFAALGLINILYGALVALRQKDFKFVIGYSSVSHMGFVILGLATLTEAGLVGAVLQMFSHGVIGAFLFAVVGQMIYSRTHTRQLDELDRLHEKMPGIAAVFVLAGLASMGLPGFSGFIAELHVLLGLWRQPSLPEWMIWAAGLGIVITFGYTLFIMHQALFRTATQIPEADHEEKKAYPPMTLPERVAAVLLFAGTLGAGLFPQYIIEPAKASLKPILQRLTE